MQSLDSVFRNRELRIMRLSHEIEKAFRICQVSHRFTLNTVDILSIAQFTTYECLYEKKPPVC